MQCLLAQNSICTPPVNLPFINTFIIHINSIPIIISYISGPPIISTFTLLDPPVARTKYDALTRSQTHSFVTTSLDHYCKLVLESYPPPKIIYRTANLALETTDSITLPHCRSQTHGQSQWQQTLVQRGLKCIRLLKVLGGHRGYAEGVEARRPYLVTRP